jgi:hypothetical protein
MHSDPRLGRAMPERMVVEDTFRLDQLPLKEADTVRASKNSELRYLFQMLIARTEFCYNFQYMVRNGRNRGDPWSLRRTGIYQQVDFDKNASCWIMLQPSDDVDKLSERALRDNSQAGNCQSGGPMFLHVLFLSTMVDSWDEYIESLHSQLQISVNSTTLKKP